MFEIREKFFLNGKPFKIISGAVHYFRTVPEYWKDRIEKLVNIGRANFDTGLEQQRKGILNGVRVNDHRHFGFDMFPLPNFCRQL